MPEGWKHKSAFKSRACDSLNGFRRLLPCRREWAGGHRCKAVASAICGDITKLFYLIGSDHHSVHCKASLGSVWLRTQQLQCSPWLFVSQACVDPPGWSCAHVRPRSCRPPRPRPRCVCRRGPEASPGQIPLSLRGCLEGHPWRTGRTGSAAAALLVERVICSVGVKAFSFTRMHENRWCEWALRCRRSYTMMRSGCRLAS